MIRVPREDHLTPSDTLHLPESSQKVSPVVDSKNRHRRIEADIGEGQALGLSSDPTGTGVLGKHHGGRLDRDDLTVRGHVEPVPAPTFKIVSASPSASSMILPRRGSGLCTY